MARIETDPNYTSPTFSRATAATDPFKKEDVQLLAAALSTHVHDGVHGLPITGWAIPNGTITSAMIADGTIDTVDLKDGSVTTAKILDSAVTSAKILDGTIATADHALASITQALLATGAVSQQLLAAGSTNNPSSSSGGFVDIPDPQISITTTGGKVFAAYIGTFSASTLGAIMGLQIAMAPISSMSAVQQWAATANQGFMMVTFGLWTGLGPGTYTLKGQFNVNAGSITGTGATRYLYAVELRA